ncbi:MAG: lipocalin family protein [Gemmatimonadaceae bacterium]|jgi:hypothetical protein
MRKLVLAIASLAVIGCGGDSTGPAGSVAGTWNLQTVNGSPLPYTAVFLAGPPVYRLEIISDTFVAAGDGTYTEALTTRETNGTTVTTTTENDHGTWTQNNNSVTVTASDGTVSTASISGNTITINEEGLVGVFHRQ